MAKDIKTTIFSQDTENKQANEFSAPDSNFSDIEYLASLLNELKQIADVGGHKLLFHLIEMASLEAEHLVDSSKAEQKSEQQDKE